MFDDFDLNHFKTIIDRVTYVGLLPDLIFLLCAFDSISPEKNYFSVFIILVSASHIFCETLFSLFVYL